MFDVSSTLSRGFSGGASGKELKNLPANADAGD